MVGVERSAMIWLTAAALLALVGCGGLQPSTPGHEAPTAGRYNPVSGETNESAR